MIRSIVVSGAAAAVAFGAAVAVQPAQAAARGAECQISGTATISPGLTTSAKPQAVTLSNVRLTGCHAGSTAAAGVPKTTTGSVSTSPNPVSTTASCASGNLALTASVAWSDGTSTDATIATKGVTASQTITGKVTSSSNPNLAPGDLVAGEVAFKPTTTAQNCAKVPVTAVTFTGVLGLGSPK
jgi:Tfp pilus assembly protein PilX